MILTFNGMDKSIVNMENPPICHTQPGLVSMRNNCIGDSLKDFG